MKQIWTTNYAGNEIRIENSWAGGDSDKWFGSEKLFVNNELQNEKSSLFSSTLTGHVVTSDGRKVPILARGSQGFFMPKCRLFIDDKEVALEAKLENVYQTVKQVIAITVWAICGCFCTALAAHGSAAAESAIFDTFAAALIVGIIFTVMGFVRGKNGCACGIGGALAVPFVAISAAIFSGIFSIAPEATVGIFGLIGALVGAGFGAGVLSIPDFRPTGRRSGCPQCGNMTDFRVDREKTVCNQCGYTVRMDLYD